MTLEKILCVGGKLGVVVLQVRLPAEFRVKSPGQKTRKKTEIDPSSWQDEGAGAVVLGSCLGDVHNNILL
jgi:hypothetical protein